MGAAPSIFEATSLERTLECSGREKRPKKDRKSEEYSEGTVLVVGLLAYAVLFGGIVGIIKAVF